MKKIINFSFLSLLLLLSSCSFEQDPLASFSDSIREGILPDDNQVLKPIPRGAIKIESVPTSPLLFDGEQSAIQISVRLLQSFQAPYTVDILNVDNLPGKVIFDKQTDQILWTPDLSNLQSLFEYIPIHIRVNFADPRPLYVEHTIYARAYRTLKGLELKSISFKNFVAGNKSATVRMVVKDLDANLNFPGQISKAPHMMVTQGSKSNREYLLPYLETLARPSLENWRDPTTWILVARFNLQKLKLKKDSTFYLNYEVFSSFGKSFGFQIRQILVKKNIVIPKPENPIKPPKLPKSPKKKKTEKKKTEKKKTEKKK